MIRCTPLKGGSKALSLLRERGSMPYEELVAAAAETCDRYRAETTIGELERRGAFVVRDGIAYDEPSGNYRKVLEALEDGPMPLDEVAARVGIDRFYAKSVLADLNRAGRVMKHPTIRSKPCWCLPMAAKEDEMKCLVTLYGPRMVDMLSEEPLTSRELAERVDLPYNTVVGMMKSFKREGVASSMVVKGNKFSMWYASDKAREMAFERVSAIRHMEDRESKPFSRKESLGGRNPDFAAVQELERIIPDMLMENGPMSEQEMMEAIGRTRPLKKHLNNMWREGKLERVFDDGEWKWWPHEQRCPL